MFYVILIILLVVGTLGAATYGGVVLLQTTQNMTDTQSNQRRFEMVAWATRNMGSYMTQSVNGYAPRYLGADYTYSALNPIWFATPFTVSGINFHYCPYTRHLGGGGTVATVLTPSSGNDYIVRKALIGDLNFVFRTLNLAATNEIFADTDAPTDTVHVFTMPSANGTAPPQCNALVTTNSTTTVPGGSVAAVTAKQLMNMQSYGASKITNLYVATATAGDGTGRDAANAMTLNQAMDVFRAVQPRIAVINFASGSYTVTSSTFASTGLALGNPTGIKLILRGTGNTTTTLDVGTAVTLDFPVDLQLEKLRLGTYNNTTNLTINVRNNSNLIIDTAELWINKMTLNGGTLTAQGSGVSYVNSANSLDIHPSSKLQMSNTFSFLTTSALTGINVYGGEIRDMGSALNNKLQVSVPSGGTAINIVSGVMNIRATTTLLANSGTLGKGIVVMPAGQLYVQRTMTISNTPTIGIDVAGLASIAAGAQITYTNGAGIGVRLFSGGEFNLAGGAVLGYGGVVPTIGVQDAGGTKIGGGSSVLTGTVNAAAAGSCWNFIAVPDVGINDAIRPTLFSRSYEGTGAMSNPNATNQPYVDFLQIDNRSYWTCVGPTPGLNPPPGASSCTASGAGDPTYDGVYTATGTITNSRPEYKNPDDRYIFFTGSFWAIRKSAGNNTPMYSNGSTGYVCPSGAWGIGHVSAVAPAPTVSY